MARKEVEWSLFERSWKANGADSIPNRTGFDRDICPKLNIFLAIFLTILLKFFEARLLFSTGH